MGKKSLQKKITDIITPEKAMIYYKDPIRFVREVIFNVHWKGFGGKYEVTKQQEEIMLSICNNRNTSVRAGRGIGKAQPYATQTPTPSGMRNFGDLEVGDEVFGSDGLPTEIVDIYEQGERDIYEVTFDDGSKTRCCKEHLWNVKDRQARRNNTGWKTVELQEIIDKGVKRNFKSGRADRQWEVPVLNNPVDYNPREVTVDPYTMGAWLGDGTRKKSEITSVDADIVNKIGESYTITKQRYSKHGYSIVGLKPLLKSYGVLDCYSYEKFIPDDYKYNTSEVRKEVLRGLLDTDGTINEGGTIRYGSTSKRLLEDIVELARSLGYKVHTNDVVKKTFYIDSKTGEKVNCKDFYRCTITPPPGELMFHLERKQARIKDDIQYRYYGKKWIESIEKVGKEKTRCIRVAAEDHLYVTSDFIITHNTGCLSWVILWWLCVRPATKVVATAPSFPQLQSVLWPEVKRWLDMSLVKNCFTWTKTRLYNADETSWAEPRTASKEEAAQGLHNEHLLLIADEASGIEDSILETIYGSLTEAANKMVMMFNPTRITGFAYDSHMVNADIWNVLAYSSERSPLVDKNWLESMKRKYVHGTMIHDVYRVHVLGEFPSGDPTAFLTLEEVYAARDNIVVKEGAVEIGIDLAAEGDDECVIAPRWGYYVVTARDLGYEDYGFGDLLSWGKTKAPETERKIWDCVKRLRDFTGYTDKIKLKIDAGGLGMPIIHHLEEKAVQYNVEIIRVNFGGSGQDYENADNEATYMWQNLKELLPFIKLPDDKSLLDELTSRRWGFAMNGKQRIESKREFKKYFKSSPDRADAVIMAFAHKENERLFVGNYAKAEERLEIDSFYIEKGGDHYMGLYVSPTGYASAVMASFNGSTLGVYSTSIGTVDEVMRDPEVHMRYNQVVGSSNMFSGGDDIAMKLLMNGIPVIEAWNYDESGSIYSLDAMAKKGSFVIGSDCDDMKNQLKTWTIDKSSSKLKETHGLCYALCQIVSALLPSNKAAFCAPDFSEFHYGKKRRAYARG